MNYVRFMVFSLLLLLCVNFSFAYKNVSSCQTIDNVFLGGDTEVRLNDSISSQDGDCFVIDVDNFVFDCQSFSNYIQGDDDFTGSGISLAYVTNVTVRNCNISDFFSGIAGYLGYGLIEDILLLSNNYGGLEMESYGSVFRNIEAYYQDETQWNSAIIFSNAFNNTLINILANGNSNGILLLDYSNNNTIIDSDLRGNSESEFIIAENVVGWGKNNTITRTYFTNSSMIQSDDWTLASPNYFIGNYYDVYTGCFDAPADLVCDSNPDPVSVSAGASGLEIFPFGNVFYLLIVVLGGYFIFN